MASRDINDMGINTRLAHAGYDPFDYHGFVNPPVVHASTVLFPDAATMESRDQKYVYGTAGTPTTDALASAINALEGSAGTILVPSGLAAVTVPLLAFLSAGDHILITDSVYSPTRNFANTMLKRLGVDVEYYDPLIGGGISGLLKPNTRVVFTESPGSHTFEIQDIPAIAAAAKAGGAVVMMDNTWATPLFFKPLDHGVDISIHAATKYPAGHSDVLLGTVSANASCWERLQATFNTLGCCAGPDDVYQVLRGLRTMSVRLERHQQSALAIARWLEEQPGVSRVLHPALESHPGHALWTRDFRGARISLSQGRCRSLFRIRIFARSPVFRPLRLAAGRFSALALAGKRPATAPSPLMKSTNSLSFMAPTVSKEGRLPSPTAPNIPLMFMIFEFKIYVFCYFLFMSVFKTIPRPQFLRRIHTPTVLA